MDAKLFEYKGEPSSKAKYSIQAIVKSTVKEKLKRCVKSKELHVG